MAEKQSQEGMTGGAYKITTIGYDQYNRDVAAEKTALDTAKTQLLEAQKIGDVTNAEHLAKEIEISQSKLAKLITVDPWSEEGQKLYPLKTTTTHFINPPTYAPGWGVGGYSGFGKEGAAKADELLGKVTGLTVGASTPELRAIAAAAQAAASGAASAAASGAASSAGAAASSTTATSSRRTCRPACASPARAPTRAPRAASRCSRSSTKTATGRTASSSA